MMGSKFSGKDRSDIVAGDILCSLPDGTKYVYDSTDYDSIPSSLTPIGVVVIPPSHDVYGTGEGAAVSLKYMSCDTPNEGSILMKQSCWGQYDWETSLKNFTQVNITDNISNPTITVSDSGYLPSDVFTGTQCSTDPTAHYYSSPFTPSPYLLDGSRNEDYYTTEYSEYNALSDFDGKGNTDILCSIATSQSDWRTASTITDNYEWGYSPAACCCWRYHTTGTNQGDWYLPAIGELGYLIVRLKTINNSINNIGGTSVSTSSSSYFWSSSDYSYRNIRGMSTGYGYLYNYIKNSGRYVRSFIHF